MAVAAVAGRTSCWRGTADWLSITCVSGRPSHRCCSTSRCVELQQPPKYAARSYRRLRPTAACSVQPLGSPLHPQLTVR